MKLPTTSVAYIREEDDFLKTLSLMGAKVTKCYVRVENVIISIGKRELYWKST